MQKIDVVIPVYKSEGSLNSLIEALVEWEKKSSLSVNYIFVEDGGKDGSFEVLIEFHLLRNRHPIVNYQPTSIAIQYLLICFALLYY